MPTTLTPEELAQLERRSLLAPDTAAALQQQAPAVQAPVRALDARMGMRQGGLPGMGGPAPQSFSQMLRPGGAPGGAPAVVRRAPAPRPQPQVQKRPSEEELVYSLFNKMESGAGVPSDSIDIPYARLPQQLQKALGNWSEPPIGWNLNNLTPQEKALLIQLVGPETQRRQQMHQESFERKYSNQGQGPEK